MNEVDQALDIAIASFVAKRPKIAAKVKPVTDFFHKHKFQILFTMRILISSSPCDNSSV